MNKESLELFDNLFDNWDKYIDRAYLSFSKLENWAGVETNKIIKRFDKKIKNLDLFDSFETTNIYEDKENGHIICIKISCKKDFIKQRLDNNGYSINDTGVYTLKWKFTPAFLIKMSDENNGAGEIDFKKSNYKNITINNLLDFKFLNYSKSHNIESLMNSIEQIDYDKVEFIQTEGISFRNNIPSSDNINYYGETIEIDSVGNFESKISKSYLEYIKSSSKKSGLIERIKKNVKKII